MEVSLTCEKCQCEIIVELEYEEINYDPRDGYSEWGFMGGIVDKEYRECQCEFTTDEDNKIMEEACKIAEEREFPDYSDTD